VGARSTSVIATQIIRASITHVAEWSDRVRYFERG
jgi:hypothetical protein